MVKTLIIGGGGMVGRKLAESLQKDGADDDLTLFDVIFPPETDGFKNRITGNITDPEVTNALAAARPDLIYHLAAIVSGEAEADFDKGWQTNMLAFCSAVMAVLPLLSLKVDFGRDPGKVPLWSG